MNPPAHNCRAGCNRPGLEKARAIHCVFIALVTMALATVQAQPVVTNYPAAGFAPTNSKAEVSPNGLTPLIQMEDVPITTVIEHLARSAGINYLIAPELTQKWTGFPEPQVSFKLTNVTAHDVLQRMLALRRIALVEDPVSNIAFIIPEGQIYNPAFAGLPAETAALHTNVIPLIQFSDVPITTAIENLARQEEINYSLDPRLSEMWTPTGSHPTPEPELNFRFENVTVWSALHRMLNIHGLVLMEDPLTHVARITFSDEPLPVTDARPLDLEAQGSIACSNSTIPLIQFSDVSFSTALEHLILQAGLHANLDPQLRASPAMISIRWENLTAKQALLALCEDYGLMITKDDATGDIQIKPTSSKTHHP